MCVCVCVCKAPTYKHKNLILFQTSFYLESLYHFASTILVFKYIRLFCLIFSISFTYRLSKSIFYLE